MTTLSIQPPFPLLTDIDGQPLENGYIWIGVANLPPIGNPIAVYWDAALTQPAALPVRTAGGYPMNNGTPGRLYVGSDYSILVQNKNGSTLYSAPAATERYSDPVITGVSSAEVSFLQAGAGAVTRTAQSKMRDVVSVLDFGADPTGVADSWQAITNAAARASASKLPLVLDGILKTSAELDFSAVPIIQSNNAVIRPSFDTGSAVKYVAASGQFIENMKLLGNLTVEWPTQDWTKERTSFYFSNVYNGEFHISSKKATRGIVCLGNNSGVVHNNFYLGDFFNNLVGVWLDAVNATGWCNMNRFYGGFFYGDGNPTGSLYASRAGHIYMASSPYPVNGNVFMYPSLEWGNTTGGYRLARLGGTRNKLFVGYCEISSGDTTWIVDTGLENFIDATYVPYVIGYDPSLSGANNRLDVSGATYPWVQGQYAYFDGGGAQGTQIYRGNSVTRPVGEFKNVGGGPGLRVGGGVDFSTNGTVLFDPTPIPFTALVSGSTTAGTGTYDRALGSIVLTAKSVSLTVSVKWTAHTGTGDIEITNLPVTSLNDPEAYIAVAVSHSGVTMTAGNTMQAWIFPNEAKIRIHQVPTGGGASAPVPLGGSGTISLTATYRIQ